MNFNLVPDRALLDMKESISKQLDRLKLEYLSDKNPVKHGFISSIEFTLNEIDKEISKRGLDKDPKLESQRALLEKCFVLEYKKEG